MSSLALAFAKNTAPATISWSGVIEVGLRDTANRTEQRTLALTVLTGGARTDSTQQRLWFLTELAQAVRSWNGSTKLLASCKATGSVVSTLLQIGSDALKELQSASPAAAAAGGGAGGEKSSPAPAAPNASPKLRWSVQSVLLAVLDCLHLKFQPSDLSAADLSSLVRLIEQAMDLYPYVCDDDAEGAAASMAAAGGSAIAMKLGHTARRFHRLLVLNVSQRPASSSSSGDEKSGSGGAASADQTLLEAVLARVLRLMQPITTNPTTPLDARTERDVFELLSAAAGVVATSQRALRLVTGTAVFAQIIALAMRSPAAISTRCIRRVCTLTELALPVVNVSTFNAAFADSKAADGAASGVDAHPFISKLLSVIGMYQIGGSCHKFCPMPNVSFARCDTIASAVVQLVRVMRRSTTGGWSDAVGAAISAQLAAFDPALIDLVLSTRTNSSAAPTEEKVAAAQSAGRKQMYGAWGALAVAGGYTDTQLRVGGRVHVITPDQPSASSTSSSGTATITGFQHTKALIVPDAATNDRLVGVASIIERTVIEPVSAVGGQGLSTAVDWKRVTAAFKHLHRLISETKDQRSDADLFRTVLVSSIVRVLLVSLSAPPQSAAVLETLQIVLSTPASSGDHKTAESIIDELISTAQLPIPLRGCGHRTDLEQKLSHLNQLLHDAVPIQSTPTANELGSTNPHVDSYLKAQAVFPYNAQAFQTWLKQEEDRIRSAVVAESEGGGGGGSETSSDHDEKAMMALGFPRALAKRALLLYNDNTELAANWLLSKGGGGEQQVKAMMEEWGPEGVDYLQERADFNAAESARRSVSNFDPYLRSTLLRTPQLLSRGERVRRLSGVSTQSVIGVSASTLASPAVSGAGDDDTSTTLLAGMHPMSGPFAPIDGAGADAKKPLNKICQLKREEVRLGQKLRVSTSYAMVMERRLANRIREVWRWFFLTEDNHWAPLSSSDTSTLQSAYDRGWTSAWIGQRDNNPSLVRLDKMCMFNEITGHGRPIRRRLVSSDVIFDPVNSPPSLARQNSDGSTPPFLSRESSSATPQTSLIPPPNLPADDRDLAEPPNPADTLPDALRATLPKLEAMGFTTTWCARALLALRSANTEQCVTWIFNHTADLEAADRKEAEERKARAKKREERKQAREQYAKYRSDIEARDAAVKAKAAAVASGSTGGSGGGVVDTKSDAKSASPVASTTSIAGVTDTLIQPLKFVDASGAAVSGVEAIRWSGQIGTVIKLDTDTKARPNAIATNALLEFYDSESGQRSTVWCPIDGLEWPERWAVVHQFPELVLGAPLHAGGVQNRRTSGITGLTADVSTGVLRVLSRHAVLQLLHSALSILVSGGAKSPPFAQLPKSFEPSTLLSVIRLLVPSTDVSGSSASLRTLAGFNSPASSSSSSSAGSGGAMDSPLSPTKRDEKSSAAGSGGMTDVKSGGSRFKEYSDLSYHSRGVIWDVLRMLIVAVPTPSATAASAAVASLFGADFASKLLPLLVADVTKHLRVSSFRVKEIESQHPYTSGIKVFGLIRFENATDIMLQFDRRCHINLAHASYVCYNDSKAEREISSHSGSDEFADTVISCSASALVNSGSAGADSKSSGGQLPSSEGRFWYSVVSGGLRQNPYEFGLLVRIIPLRESFPDEQRVINESTLGWNLVSVVADHFDKFLSDTALCT